MEGNLAWPRQLYQLKEQLFFKNKYCVTIKSIDKIDGMHRKENIIDPSLFNWLSKNRFDRVN